jgi:hypothetical protein
MEDDLMAVMMGRLREDCSTNRMALSLGPWKAHCWDAMKGYPKAWNLELTKDHHSVGMTG